MWQKTIEKQGFQYSLCRTLEEFKEVVLGIIKN